jgi:fatty acid desaturase
MRVLGGSTDERTETMEDPANLIEALLARAAAFGKTSFELEKLKALDKTSAVGSSFIPHSVVVVIIASFILFISLGLAFWLGGILGKIYFGFFAVAAFYGFSVVIFHFFMHKWLKRSVRDFLIKQMLK